MFHAPPPRSRSRPRDAAPADDEGTHPHKAEGAHLRLVDGDVYTDWESVYRDNVERLYRLMYARLGNRQDAEDLTSEVFRTALGPLRLASSRGEVRAYLLVTAQTVLASHWRRTLGLQVTSIDPALDLAYLAEPSGPVPPSDAPQRAGSILAALPDRYRRVLELRFLEACSIKEVAKAMDVSVSNAKVLQHRALLMAVKVAQEMAQ